jgi:hypothetical protein
MYKSSFKNKARQVFPWDYFTELEFSSHKNHPPPFKWWGMLKF